jgi:hypothetical protein
MIYVAILFVSILFEFGQPHMLTRRRMISSIPLTLPVFPGIAHSSTREYISKVASTLPGYGPRDCTFPITFSGMWEVDRNLVSIIPEGSSADFGEVASYQSVDRIGTHLRYRVRFFEFGESVIADREFNLRNLERVTRVGSKIDVADCEWAPDNPNVLACTYSDGSTREVKVTKRSLEAQEGGFGSTEFAQVTVSPAPGATGRSVPQLGAMRTLSRFRVLSADVVEGVELVLYYPTGALLADSKPALKFKSRLTFNRVREDKG